MENTDLRKYELVLIVDAKKTHEQKEAAFKETIEIVQKFNAKVISSNVWIEKQKFTFVIKKCKEGTYYLINFESLGSAVASIRGALRVKENILRFAITKFEEEKEKQVK